MANPTSIIQDLVAKLKVTAGPWKKDIKDTVDQLASALETLLPMTIPSEPIVKHAVQLLRHVLRRLYTPFATISLQLSVATFSFIFHERILIAFKTKAVKQKRAWEIIAQAVLDGVLDYLDDNSNGKEKDAVAQAFYSTIGSIFFCSSSAISPTTCNAKLRTMAYLLLSTSCEAHPRNQEKLRNKLLLGSERLGYVVSITKDYLALEQLLDLFARLIPPTKGSSEGRVLRMQFITEVFLTGARHLAESVDIVKFLEYIPSSNWEETSAQVVEILARNMSFPQPFRVKEVSIAGVSYPQTPPSDLLYVDSDALLANSRNEDDVYDVIRVPFSILQLVTVVDDGMVHVLTSRPVKVGDRKTSSQVSDEQPAVIAFEINATDVERFAGAISARGLGSLVQRNGHHTKLTTHISKSVRPTELEFTDDGKSLSQTLSYIEKVKIVQQAVHLHDHSDDGPPPETYVDVGADGEPLLSAQERGTDDDASADPRQSGQTPSPHRLAGAAQALADERVPGMPETIQERRPEPDGPHSAALPPVRARPAGRPTSHPSCASADGPERHVPDGLPTPTARDTAPRRSASQERHDAVFGTSDEELSDLSDDEHPRAHSRPPAGILRARCSSRSGPGAPDDAGQVPLGNTRDRDAPREEPANGSEGAAQDEELGPVVKVRRRTVVSQDDREAAGEGKKGSAKTAKKKRAVECEEENAEAMVEPTSKAKSRAVRKQAKKGPAGRSVGGKKLAMAKKTNGKKRACVEPGFDGGSAGTEREAPTTRGRSSRSTAAAALEKMARNIEAKHEGTDVIDRQEKETTSKSCGKPESAGENDVAVGGRKDKAEPASLISSTDSPPDVAPAKTSAAAGKRKRGGDEEDAPAASSCPLPGIVPPPAKRGRVQPNLQTPTSPRRRPSKDGTTKTRPPAKKYGHRAAKQRISSPSLSTPNDVDYDELPGFSFVAPQVDDSSSPAPVIVSTGKSKVAGMKARIAAAPASTASKKDDNRQATAVAKTKVISMDGVKAVQKMSKPPSMTDYVESPTSSDEVSSPSPAPTKKAVMDTAEIGRDMDAVAQGLKYDKKRRADTQRGAAPAAHTSAPAESKAAKAPSQPTKKSNKAPWLAAEHDPPTVSKEPDVHVTDRIGLGADDVEPQNDALSLSDGAADAHPSVIEEFTFCKNSRFLGDPPLPAASSPKTAIGTNFAAPELSKPPRSPTCKAKPPSVTVDLTADEDAPVRPKARLANKASQPPAPRPASHNPKVASSADEDNTTTIAPQDISTGTYEEAYEDFLIQLNSSGQLFSPADKTMSTVSEPQTKWSAADSRSATLDSGKLYKKNVSFAPVVEEVAAEKEAKERQGSAAIQDDSGLFWREDENINRPPKAKEKKRVLTSHLSEVGPPIALPPVAKLAKAKLRKRVDTPERFDDMARMEEGRDIGPIASIIDRIASVVKEKIESGFDGVSRSTREAQRRILHYAVEELREVGKSNAPTYNSLVNLEEAYGAYSRNVISALDEAIRVSEESRQHVQHVIQEHDRGVQAYSKSIMKRRELPLSVNRWL
ncbi:hypothetical protein DENSPDRAFT_929478 [Dentipellis sp. KUC8613]|nr:hypothetical protein DENSPDRAFT_929478 [Dentipellis sp. KUC8613]